MKYLVYNEQVAADSQINLLHMKLCNKMGENKYTYQILYALNLLASML